jgi:hypothetical protein
VWPADDRRDAGARPRRLTEFDHFAFLTVSITLESAAFAPSSVPAMELFYQQPSKPMIITGIDVSGRSTSSEELMRILVVTFATATVLAFAFSQTPRVLAQGSDAGAVGRPFQLYTPPGSGNRGHGGPSEDTERSGAATSEKSETGIGNANETTIHGSSRARHRFVLQKRGHHFLAFHYPRHPFVIHRRGHRFVAFNESSGSAGLSSVLRFENTVTGLCAWSPTRTRLKLKVRDRPQWVLVRHNEFPIDW